MLEGQLAWVREVIKDVFDLSGKRRAPEGIFYIGVFGIRDLPTLAVSINVLPLPLCSRFEDVALFSERTPLKILHLLTVASFVQLFPNLVVQCFTWTKRPSPGISVTKPSRIPSPRERRESTSPLLVTDPLFPRAHEILFRTQTCGSPK